jgi:hypothetical protein
VFSADVCLPHFIKPTATPAGSSEKEKLRNRKRVHTREHCTVFLSLSHAILHRSAREFDVRSERAAAAASDSLVALQSSVSVSPPLQSLWACSSPRCKSGSTDSISKRASLCTYGRQRNTCKDSGGAGICTHGRVRSKLYECGGGAQKT